MQDVAKCEGAITLIHEASLRFDSLHGRLLALNGQLESVVEGTDQLGQLDETLEEEILDIDEEEDEKEKCAGGGNVGQVEEDNEERQGREGRRVDAGFSSRRGKGKGGVAWEVDVGVSHRKVGASTGGFLSQIQTISDDEVTKEEEMGGAQVVHGVMAENRGDEGVDSNRGGTGEESWGWGVSGSERSPHYPFSDLGNSPFGTASFLSGFSGDGGEEFFPPLPPGEGDLLEAPEEDTPGIGDCRGQGKENVNVVGGDCLGDGGHEPLSAGSMRQGSEANFFAGGGVSRQASTVSCASVGSGGLRSLHDKLMSPERHRRQRPDEVLRKHDEKQRLALERKEALEAQRQEKLRGAEQQRQDKLRQLRERRENFQCSMDQRLRRAQELREAKVLEKQLKAQKEHSKVHGVKQEIAFMELLNAESKTYELQHRLESAEARRLQSLEATARSSVRKIVDRVVGAV